MIAGRFIAALLAALSMMTGCGSREEPSPVEDSAFGDMTGTMDKARGVESTLQQEKREVDEAIDAADGR